LLGFQIKYQIYNKGLFLQIAKTYVLLAFNFVIHISKRDTLKQPFLTGVFGSILPRKHTCRDFTKQNPSLHHDRKKYVLYIGERISKK
jgi:hypothetical protein